MKRTIVIAMHIGYWILYLALLALFILFLEAGGIKTISQGHKHMMGFLKLLTMMTILPAIAGFYIFYGFLFDKYLSNKKIALLCIVGLIFAMLSGMLGLAGLAVVTNGKMIMNNQWREMLYIILFMSLLSLVHGVIALVMKGFIKWYGDIKIKEDLRQKNFETELALVKSQLSPHFLFNTINNIDVLIQKDPQKASEYLIKLSDIMRFMLYETKVELTPLQQELVYIGKYIDLQKIRTNNPECIQYIIKGEPANRFIAPMVFIPFIENACKHAVHMKTGTSIFIRLYIDEKGLHFSCENQFSDNKPLADDYSGIGNELIRKRLGLLYKHRHTLVISKEDKTYRVQLSIFNE